MNKLFLKLLTQIFRLFHIKRLTIYQFTLILLIFTATFSVLIESGLWTYTESVRVRQNVKKLKEYTLNQQKEQLKEEVDRVIAYIEFRKKDTLSKPIPEIKNEVLDFFKDDRFGNDGYIFINTYDGFALLFDGQKLDYEKDISGLTDPNGIQLFKKELELSKLPDGGFFQYYFKKIYDTTPKPKLSYARGFDEWGWIIGAGDYLDNIDKEIALLEKDFKYELFQNFLIVLGVFIVVLSLLILLASLAAKSIQSQFDQLVHFLKNAPLKKQDDASYKDIFIQELKVIGDDIVHAEKLAQQYGDIINQSNNEIYIFGQDDLLFVHVNKGAMQNCGYSLSELQQKTPLFLMTELNMKSFVALLEPLKQKQKKQIRFENVLRRKDNTIYPVEVHLAPSSFNEKPVFIAFIYDISARKAAEIQLQISNQRFVDLFNNAPISLWEEDYTELMAYLETQLKQQGLPIEKLFTEHPEVLQRCSGLAKVLNVNNHTLKLYEAQNIEELLEGLDRTRTPDFMSVFSQSLISLSNGNNYFSAEGKSVTLKGKELDLILRWSFLPRGENQELKVIISTINLTELRKTEQKLKYSEIQFRSIFEQAADAIYLSDFDGNLLEVNSEATKEMGYTREEFLQMKIWELDESYSDLASLKVLWNNLKPNAPIAIETFHKRKDGSIFPVEIRAALTEIEGKKAVLGFARNVDNRKKTEAELNKYRQHLEELVEERTKELEVKNKSLERINKAFVGRELRMKELKEEIKKLKGEKDE